MSQFYVRKPLVGTFDSLPEELDDSLVTNFVVDVAVGVGVVVICVVIIIMSNVTFVFDNVYNKQSLLLYYF